MNIELSSQEYRDLLDILHIADVVMSGHRRDEDVRSMQHRALVQKLYALARSEGLEGLIQYREKDHVYYPTAEFEESTLAHVLINELENHLFWDQLIGRLSVRDAAQMVGGISRLTSLDDHERQNVEGPIRQRYIQEFASHGVNNLEVIEKFQDGHEAHIQTSD
jgi:hypothetical protein